MRAVPRRDARDAARLARHAASRSRSSASTCKDNRAAAAGSSRRSRSRTRATRTRRARSTTRRSSSACRARCSTTPSGKQTFVHQGPYFDRAAPRERHPPVRPALTWQCARAGRRLGRYAGPRPPRRRARPPRRRAAALARARRGRDGRRRLRSPRRGRAAGSRTRCDAALPVVAGAHAQRTDRLRHGDELALLTPVAGG